MDMEPLPIILPIMLTVECEGALQRLGFRLATQSPVSGGCISQALRLTSTSGERCFLKLYRDAPTGLFAGEATGLAALAAVSGAPRTPAVLAQGNSFILLEDLTPGRQVNDYWERFGRELACLHAHHGPHFGFTCDNHCGSTPQPNPATSDGCAFFATARLGYQSRLAESRGLLSSSERRLIEQLGERLPELVPGQPASLIHGDLWSGNAHTGPNGEPVLIDPAAHWGWAEAELAMTLLFGGFPARFYAAYVEAGNLASDWEERVELYNSYHLLNHLNLFGRSYHAQVMAAIQRYL